LDLRGKWTILGPHYNHVYILTYFDLYKINLLDSSSTLLVSIPIPPVNVRTHKTRRVNRICWAVDRNISPQNNGACVWPGRPDRSDHASIIWRYIIQRYLCIICSIRVVRPTDKVCSRLSQVPPPRAVCYRRARST